MLHTHIMMLNITHSPHSPHASFCIDLDKDPEQDEPQLSLAVPESRSSKLVEYSVPAKA